MLRNPLLKALNPPLRALIPLTALNPPLTALIPLKALTLT
jgi:hypothetical protein